MHHPIDRITHTTAFVTPVVEHWLEREIAQWVHPMKDRSDDPSHLCSNSEFKKYILFTSHSSITKNIYSCLWHLFVLLLLLEVAVIVVVVVYNYAVTGNKHSWYY